MSEVMNQRDATRNAQSLAKSIKAMTPKLEKDEAELLEFIAMSPRVWTAVIKIEHLVADATGWGMRFNLRSGSMLRRLIDLGLVSTNRTGTIYNASESGIAWLRAREEAAGDAMEVAEWDERFGQR